jgi:thiol-disulfide isomerase/thioredoxin
MDSNFYFFYTIGCGWCKKAIPVIDKLNEDGHDILKLDLAEKENKEIEEDLKKKYNIRCGTPLFINAETGHNVCGFRDKETILKWINGEEIPPPPRPKSPGPRIPFKGSSKTEIKKWKKVYEEWVDENSHLPDLKTADELLALPRPKSQMPPVPRPPVSNNAGKKWKKEYDKWMKDNSHLPNLTPSDVILNRVMNQQQPNQGNVSIDGRLRILEAKMDRLMNHLGVK